MKTKKRLVSVSVDEIHEFSQWQRQIATDGNDEVGVCRWIDFDGDDNDDDLDKESLSTDRLCLVRTAMKMPMAVSPGPRATDVTGIACYCRLFDAIVTGCVHFRVAPAVVGSHKSSKYIA